MGAFGSALQRVMGTLRQLSRVPSAAAADASKDIAKLIADQFSGQSDPYGNAWAPLKQSTIDRWGEHSTLDLFGSMKDIDVRPAPGAGIVIRLGAEYSRFHQTGTRYMASRPILPWRGLPDTWRRVIADAVDAAFQRTAGAM
jgi:hypothetical protein